MATVKARPAQRIVAVLGMHRSGTSAVARGLQALGVDLGPRLMPGVAGNNERGFFEDLDANAINIELLHALGREWDSLAPIAADELGRADLDRLRVRALELLRQRLRGHAAYGLKDPRISLLLPFWKPLFTAVPAEARYVLCSRHPLEVARSLEKRDGMDLEKSLYLWMGHVAAMLAETAGSARVVVGYEALLADPASELARVAAALELPFDPRSPQFAEYAREFLTEELRHSSFTAADLRHAANVPADVIELHEALERMARGEEPVDSAAATRIVERVRTKLAGMGPILEYVSRRDARHFELTHEALRMKDRIGVLEHQVAERSGHAANLERTLEELKARAHELLLGTTSRDGQIHALNVTLGERSAHLARLEADLAERDAGAARLEATVAKLEGTVAGLEARVAERSGHAANLERTIGELNARIHELGLAVSARDGQIHGLNLTVAERDARLHSAERTAQESAAQLAEARDAAARRGRLLEEAIARLRSSLGAEAGQAERTLAALRGADYGGAAAPREMAGVNEALQRCAAELRAADEILGERDLARLDEPALARCFDDASAVRIDAWTRLARATASIARSLAESDRELELNRLRLLDALRDSGRARTQAGQLAARVNELEARLGHSERELAEARRVLGQFGHQFVTRIGTILDPYPAVRWVITAPLRLVHWLLERARA